MTNDKTTNYGTTSSQSEASSSSSSPLITSSKSSVYDDEAQIPPPDRGRAAWLFLFGCFWLEGLVWGNHILSWMKTLRLMEIKDFRFHLAYLKDTIPRMNHLHLKEVLLP